MQIEKYISPFIESQFPQFYREEGPAFIDFVRAYYEWMESNGNIINFSRSLLEYRDIDTTLENFIVYFKEKYINSLPESVVADKKLLIKHILDLYRSKGTNASYKLLFRMIFNEDIDIYVPSNYIFKPSDGEWIVPKYIEVSDSKYLSNLIGKKIYSSSTFASAIVENYYTQSVENKLINVLSLSHLEGNFKYGEKILSETVPEITINNAPIIFGSLSSVSITNGGLGYKVGDILQIKNSGSGGLALVTSTTSKNGEVEFNLIKGGTGFSLNSVINIDGAQLDILKVYNSNPAIVETVNPHMLSNSTPVRIDYVNGVSSINTSGYSYFIKTVNSTAFSLYSDINLATPINGESYGSYLGISQITKSNPVVLQCYGTVVNSVFNGTAIVPHGLSDSELISVEYATGMTELNNNSYYVKSVNTTAFSLYTDQNLTIPVNSTGYGTYNSNTGYVFLQPKFYGHSGYVYINTGGAGATFKIGSIVNREIYKINVDHIADYMNTVLDDKENGYEISVSNINGTFSPGHTVSMGNVDLLEIDCRILTQTLLANGENLSNSSLGILNLTVVNGDESYVELKGSDITNANLVSGILLISNTSSTSLQINTKFPIKTVNATANVITANSTVLSVNNQSGYFISGELINDITSGANAIIGSARRMTDWYDFGTALAFPFDRKNLNLPIYALTYVDKEVGTIASLTDINPGIGYTLDPVVSIIEPLVAELNIYEQYGPYKNTQKGFNSQFSANAIFASGIVSSIKVIDSGYGYDRNQVVNLKSNNNPYTVTGTTVVDLTGLSNGYWKNNKSFISDNMYLQDSNYYQKYSYEIIASRMLNTYEEYVKNLVHPVGMKLFGRYVIKNEFNINTTVLVSSSFEQSL